MKNDKTLDLRARGLGKFVLSGMITPWDVGSSNSTAEVFVGTIAAIKCMKAHERNTRVMTYGSIILRLIHVGWAIRSQRLSVNARP